MRKLKLAGVLLAATVATGAHAQDKPFEGPAVTAVGGLDVSRAAGDSKSGALYGAQLGYDLQRGGVAFGVEGEVIDASTRHV